MPTGDQRGSPLSEIILSPERRWPDMPKYLIEASYGSEGVKGVAAKGGTARREAVTQLIDSMGGSIESFYFAFGDADVYVVCDLPSNEAASALALSINRSEATKIKTVVLLTPEQVDAAANMTPEYKPPGS
jgi:uncharacterized protein with GYD domain